MSSQNNKFNLQALVAYIRECEAALDSGDYRDEQTPVEDIVTMSQGEDGLGKFVRLVWETGCVSVFRDTPTGVEERLDEQGRAKSAYAWFETVDALEAAWNNVDTPNPNPYGLPRI